VPAPASRACQAVSDTDSSGQPLPTFYLDQVQAVHDAACRRDFDALAQQMDTPFQGRTPAELAAQWRQAGPGDPRIDALTTTLEGKGMLTQGGLVFCHTNGGVAIFGRGTNDRPGKWTDFYVSPGAACPADG
jgi:hypothetical protein